MSDSADRRGSPRPNAPARLVRTLGRAAIARNTFLYRLWLTTRGAAFSPSRPDLSDVGEGLPLRTLQSPGEYEAAVETVRSLGLHPHTDEPKNWDGLLALRSILGRTGRGAAVLDAGGAEYSPLVQWLALYGYRDLHVHNIAFDGEFRRGPITYRAGDVTDTAFPDGRFDVVVVQSVIEHGLDVAAALSEFHRLLAPGGRVLLSTDYWADAGADADEVTEYGAGTQGWRLFDEAGIRDLLGTAGDVGFEAPDPDPAALACDERVIEWNGESYTFLYLELRVPPGGE